MMLQDALVAYKTYARAEGKSPKTIRWIMSSVAYFTDFLGPEPQDIASITGSDLRGFIIALQGKRKFSNHPYNQPQRANLSPQSIETYCRAIRAFLAFFTVRALSTRARASRAPREAICQTRSELASRYSIISSATTHFECLLPQSG